ncbi:hypothetical protein EJB05_31995, partial [Eragrostis curvula]
LGSGDPATASLAGLASLPSAVTSDATSKSKLAIASRDCNSTVTEEIKNSIVTSLSKIALKEYNPLQHERGFHSKLICLVKNSLQFGSIDPACALRDTHHIDSFNEPQVSACQGPEENFLTQAADKAGSLNEHIRSFSEPQTSSFRIPKEKTPSQSKNGKPSPSISEEWEKLIIIDDLNDDIASPAAPRPASPWLAMSSWRSKPRANTCKAKKPRANTSQGLTLGMQSG